MLLHEVGFDCLQLACCCVLPLPPVLTTTLLQEAVPGFWQDVFCLPLVVLTEALLQDALGAEPSHVADWFAP
jgi:hypothetical protein